MVNIGLIGFGKMGRIRYDVLKDMENVRVVAATDPHAEIDVEGVEVVGTVEDLLARPDIDAVVIGVPNCFNRPYAIGAMQAGKHVFCEKPPCMNGAEMREIREVERTTGMKLMYGFNHRQHGSVIKARELVDSGRYGKLLWMRGRYGKSVDQNFFNDWRSRREQSGGGILLDQGIHMVDLFLMMAGHFEEVKAFVSDLYWKLDVEDNVFAMFRNTDGVVASLHSTMTQWRHLFSLEMFLEKGYLVINGLLTSSQTYGEEVLVVAKNRTTAPAATWEDEERFQFPVDNSWQLELSHFVDVIEKDTPVVQGTSEDAQRVMDLMDLIYQDGRNWPGVADAGEKA